MCQCVVNAQSDELLKDCGSPHGRGQQDRIATCGKRSVCPRAASVDDTALDDQCLLVATLIQESSSVDVPQSKVRLDSRRRSLNQRERKSGVVCIEVGLGEAAGMRGVTAVGRD